VTFTVVGVGEVLWDLLPAGPQLGGAPTNFTYQAGALGARAMMVTRVGNDDLGREVIERFRKMALRVFLWVKVAHFLFKRRAACRSVLSIEGILHPEVHTLGAG